MLTSLAFVFLAGLAAAALCQLLHIPRILGMLAIGIVLGPYALNLLDPSILSISADLREMALIIILLKAGLSLDLSDLKRVGRPAVLMAFVPASCEILACILFAPALLGLSRIEAAVLGAVLGSVPLAMGLPCGQIVLSAAVLAILLTAPLGAFGIDLSYRRLLEKDGKAALNPPA